MIALCLGGAMSVWADLQRAQQLVGAAPALLVASNFAGLQHPGRVDAWVTLHPERLADWMADRALAGRPPARRLFAHETYPGCKVEARPERWAGSSGLFAAQVALEALGATHAILCGVPMDAAQRHIHWGRWKLVPRYRDGVLKAQADGANIRSMSGWTAEVLEAPDAAWLRRDA